MRLALLVSLIAMSAASAVAQSPLPKSGPMPAQGKPPATPFSLPPEERFKAIDVDHDGKVTKVEFKAVLNPEAQKSIERIWVNRDTNADGWLTSAELSSNGASRFPAGPGGPGGGPQARAAIQGQGGGQAAPAPEN